jgi:uncharacterized protein
MSSGLRVSDLFLYPLKSGGGVPVTSAALDPLGVSGDRRWMVVDANQRFLSQRELPEMALLRASLNGGGITLGFPGHDPLHVDAPSSTAARVPVTVWDDTFEALSAAPDASAWMSRVLGTACTIVYCPPETERRVDPDYASDDERVSFADGFPLLVIGQASLDDLNTRLEQRGQSAVPMNRFRPNIVIAGGEPFAEDGWKRILIGDGPDAIPLDIVKPCARCSTVPVDQATGVRGKEPLAILATFRRRGKHVYFGQNALHRALGTIRRGDAVRVVESAG